MLLLRAYHEGGQVNIEITDDGGGIDVERVKRKALEKGLVTPEQIARMKDRDLVHLIFLPGFSTAAAITSVSGRGVGMDVVKTNVEKIGGTVDIVSRLEVGTTVKVKIPLTLAIIPALVVTAGGDRYAIPQANLVEMVRLEEDSDRPGTETVYGAPVLRLRGRLLPLVFLPRELHRDSQVEPGVVNIVVLQADERQFGLVVDTVQDTEEIVVKPLSRQLKRIPLFSGATIMGDGRVTLILDIVGMARRSHVVSEGRDRPVEETALLAGPATAAEEHAILMFGVGEHHRVGLPLATVARLEELPVDQVEWAEGREVVQYRGEIMPLLRLADLLRTTPATPTADILQVIVARQEGRQVGLIVDHILDVVDTQLQIKPSGRQPGILGAAVIQQRVTELLDVPYLFEVAHSSPCRELALAGAV
jgi:two-component system chemotaxis sensor kinase CheA